MKQSQSDLSTRQAGARLADVVAGASPRPRAISDDRWPAIVAALTRLKAGGRHSVRIVDADCGTGTTLLHAALRARGLGFTAVEARGIDGAPAPISSARVAAAAFRDPAIGIAFDVADLVTALADEIDLPADILLWRRPRCVPAGIARAVARAGCIIIDGEAAGKQRAAGGRS